MIERVAHLETRVRVTVVPSEDMTVRLDADQIQQGLINLVRNAADATLNPDATAGEAPTVQVGRQKRGREVVIAVCDNGPGLTNESNLFVPFYDEAEWNRNRARPGATDCGGPPRISPTGEPNRPLSVHCGIAAAGTKHLGGEGAAVGSHGKRALLTIQTARPESRLAR